MTTTSRPRTRRRDAVHDGEFLAEFRAQFASWPGSPTAALGAIPQDNVTREPAVSALPSTGLRARLVDPPTESTRFWPAHRAAHGSHTTRACKRINTTK